MQAMRGRASYTGERSIGTLDAGAVAVAVMFEAPVCRFFPHDEPLERIGKAYLGSGTAGRCRFVSDAHQANRSDKPGANG